MLNIKAMNGYLRYQPYMYMCGGIFETAAGHIVLNWVMGGALAQMIQ